MCVSSQTTETQMPGSQSTSGTSCSALHGHVRVASHGTVYLPIKGCGGTPTAGNLTITEFFGGHAPVSVSSDNWQTWSVRRVHAGDNQVERDPSVAPGRGDKVPCGRLYLGREDGVNPTGTTYGTTSSARVAMSTDHGRTWSKPVDVCTPGGRAQRAVPRGDRG